jgi:hypothetical protein
VRDAACSAPRGRANSLRAKTGGFRMAVLALFVVLIAILNFAEYRRFD